MTVKDEIKKQIFKHKQINRLQLKRYILVDKAEFDDCLLQLVLECYAYFPNKQDVALL